MTVNGSTVTLRRPKTSLTKQYTFSAPEFDVTAHITTALNKCESVTVLSVGAQGAGKTTTLLGVAEASIGAAFAALGAAADERLVTFSALTSVVSGSPVRERLVDLLDDAPQPNAGQRPRARRRVAARGELLRRRPHAARGVERGRGGRAAPRRGARAAAEAKTAAAGGGRAHR